VWGAHIITKHITFIRETRERRRHSRGARRACRNISANCTGGHEIKTKCRCVAALQTTWVICDALEHRNCWRIQPILQISKITSIVLLSFELAIASFWIRRRQGWTIAFLVVCIEFLLAAAGHTHRLVGIMLSLDVFPCHRYGGSLHLELHLWFLCQSFEPV